MESTAETMLTEPTREPCPTCDNLQRSQFEVSFAELQPRCGICSAIRTAIEVLCAFDATSESPQIEVTFVSGDPMRLECGLFDIEVKPEYGGGLSMQIFSHARRLNDHASPWPDIGAARMVQSEALTDESLELATSWLRNCLDSHDKCGAGRTQSNKRPKRLLFVGDRTTPPRLCISEDTGQEQYLTLSHCWGLHVPLKTTKATLMAHQQSIPLQTLPKTFRDAIRVTEYLGYQYIWIDSLCIVQDSVEDWDEESAKMGDIYANAVLTICADAAHDGTVGLSGPDRKVFTSIPVWNDTLFASRLGCVHKGFGISRAVSPLQQRAWTLQEKILSHRILHFDTDETKWECRSQMACECSGTWDSQMMKTFQSRTVSFLQQAIHTPTELVPYWRDLVEEYTRRNITYQSDLLPAVAGIASKIAEIGSFTYLSGLWKEGLEESLLWASRTGGARHHEYYCPTWLWPSVIGQVHFPMLRAAYREFFVLVIHQAVCEHQGRSVFMPPKSGYLEVTAPVASMVQRNEQWAVDMPWELVKTDVYPDISGWSEFDHSWDVKFLIVSWNGIVRSERGSQKYNTTNENPQRFHGLVITKTESKEGLYKRIGYCQYVRRDVPAGKSYLEDFPKMQLTLI